MTNLPIKKLIAIDPSSSCTGYVVFDIESCGVIESGLLKPIKSASKLVGDMSAWRRAWMGRDEMRAMVRIESMLVDLIDILNEHEPSVVVIEVTSGRAGTGSKRGASSSLGVYGMAAGAMFAAAMYWSNSARLATGQGVLPGAGAEVVPVTERQWTAGCGGKDRRMYSVVSQWPAYDHKLDKGGDMADAWGLGKWWLERETTCCHDYLINVT